MRRTLTLGLCPVAESLFLYLVLVSFGSVAHVRAQKISPLKGNGPISMSLEFYNPLNISTWIIRNLDPYSVATVSVGSAPSDVRFYVIQTHAHIRNVSLSYNQTLIPHYHVNGTNLGLVWKTKQGLGNFYVFNSNPENVTVMLAVVAYGAYSPVPGGCNMEFEVETAPYLKVWYTDTVMEVNAQQAQTPGASCTKDYVSHDMYHMFMSERDFTEESYFSAIQAMLTPHAILANGSLAPVPVYGSIMRRLYSLYAGTGSVYVVLAHSLAGVSAYVPAVSYGCSGIFFTDSCTVLTTTFSKVLCACVLFLGFFSCLYGHFFFRIQLFLTGFLSGSLLAYIGLVQLTSLPYGSGVTLSCLVGLGLGTSYLVFWYLSAIPVVSIVLLVSPLGFLLASLVFYIGLGDLQFAQLDLDYWLTFILLMLSVTLLLLPLVHHASMLSSAVVGAFAVVATLDHYTGGNLKYIVINTLRRASVPGFGLAVIDPPFQVSDILLSILWLLLSLIGLRVQQIRQTGRPPFPPSGRRMRPIGLPRCPEAPSAHTARTPLQVSSRIPYSYGSIGDDDVFETPPQARGPESEPSGPRAFADWVGRGLGLRGR